MPFFTASPAILEQIVDRAIEQVMLRSIGIMESTLGEDGQAYGDENLSDGDFIAFYNDLVEHTELVDNQSDPFLDEQGQPVVDEQGIPQFNQVPMPFRELDHLRVIAPKYAQRLDDQYERVISRMLEAG